MSMRQGICADTEVYGFEQTFCGKYKNELKRILEGSFTPVEVEQYHVSDSLTKDLAEVLVKLAVNKQRIKGIYLHRLK